jgi:hypothetical protein
MKKSFSVSGFLILLLIIISTSCKKDNTIQSLDEQIIGMWDVQSIQQVSYENDVKVSETTVFLKTDELSFQFAEGGTGIQYQDGEIAGVFTWEITDSTIHIEGGDQSLDWSVTIENNILVWSYPESEVINDITYKYEFFYSAKRASV